MLLVLDTTTEWLHLALVGEGEAAFTRALKAEPGQSHSVLLLPALQGLLETASLAPKELTGCVVCVGPGGFTSLRTGVATAEGLALTGLPVWGFSAFELRAKALRFLGVHEPLWVLLDGQRQETFAQRWGDQALNEAARWPLSALGSHVKGEPWWAPAGFRERVEGALGRPGLGFEDEQEATLQALVALGREKAQGAPENPLIPFYLRETDAEMNFPQVSGHLSEALRRGQAR